jgi:hypothetical protein
MLATSQKRGIEYNWNVQSESYNYDSPKLLRELEKGTSVGAYPAEGSDLILFDVDDAPAFNAAGGGEWLASLNDGAGTLTWSPHIDGNSSKFKGALLVPDMPDYVKGRAVGGGVLIDKICTPCTVQEHTWSGDGKLAGKVDHVAKTKGGMVTIPPSPYKTGARIRVTNDVKIAVAKWSDLERFLNPDRLQKCKDEAAAEATLDKMPITENVIGTPPPLTVKRKERERDQARHDVSRASISDQLGLRCEDILMPVNPTINTSSVIQGAHPVHGSVTGNNFKIDRLRNRWYCHRAGHESGGGPLELICVADGILDCGDCHKDVISKRGLWHDVFLGLEKRGHDLSIIKPTADLSAYLQKIHGVPGPASNATLSMSGEAFINKRQDNPKLSLNVDDDSLISLYLKYGAERTDSYAEYHYAGVLALLSTMVNKNAYMELQTGTIFTNLWLLLLGKSTVSRKSTAVGYVSDFVSALRPQLRMDSPGSAQGFLENLMNEGAEAHLQGKGILIVDEAAELLKMLKHTYMAELRDTLCKLYDNSPISNRIRSGQRANRQHLLKVEDPYFSQILSTTPENFTAEARVDDIRSGYLLRFLCIWPDYKRPMRGVDELRVTTKDLQKQVWHRLAELRDLFDEMMVKFSFTPESKAYYNTWLSAHHDRLMASENDDAGAFSRLSVMAIKIAMLHEMAKADFVERARESLSVQVEKPDDGDLSHHAVMLRKTFEKLFPAKTMKMMALGVDVVSEACRLVDDFFTPHGEMVRELAERSDSGNQIEKVLSAIKRSGGRILRNDLLKHCHIKSKDLTEVIDTLRESEEVEEVDVDGKIGYMIKEVKR